MRIDDAERPQWLNGQAMYLDGDGKAVSPLPCITINVDAKGVLAVSIYGKVAWNEFSEYFWKAANPHGIPKLLEYWREDPEQTMKDYFGYVPPLAHAAKRKNTWGGEQGAGSTPSGRRGLELTLDDLGL
jgi:hypothetical protein